MHVRTTSANNVRVFASGQRVMQLRGARAMVVTLMVLASTASGQSVSTDFDMEFPNGNDTSLVSAVESSFGFEYITHSFHSNLVDGITKVHWLDKNKKTLLRAESNQELVLGAPSPGLIDKVWMERLGFGAFASKAVVAKGTADFSGSVTSKRPCGSSFICPAEYLEKAPSIFGGGSSGGPGSPGNQRLQAAQTLATPIIIGQTEARFAARVLNPPTDPNPNDFTTTSLVTFASKVEQAGSEYTYTFTVTNDSDSKIAFDWAAAGFSGEVDATDSKTMSFVSALAPQTVRSVAASNIRGFDIQGGMDLLTPIPEPAQWLIALLGFGLLAIRLGRRPPCDIENLHPVPLVPSTSRTNDRCTAATYILNHP